VGGTHPNQIFKRRKMPKRWGNRSPSKMNLQKGFGVKGLQKKIIRNIISTPT